MMEFKWRSSLLLLGVFRADDCHFLAHFISSNLLHLTRPSRRVF
jgi:hypothetical protein